MSLENLRQKRLKWVEANRENNFEEGIKRLLTDLYPDNAHFIYELLQNAEDPRASTVRFTLTDDAVEFEHDGERLFDLKDVESITSIGASTKRDDPTSIGEFGVGFKAVFAYTHTPEIHSGDFHFRIHDLVVPDTKGVSNSAIGDHNTRFVFPFDHPAKRPTQAVEEVERALSALGDNTLLFLSHIRTIEYLLPDGSLGSLERIDHENGRIEIRARHPGGEETVSHWLRFQKDVEVADESGKNKNGGVAIAYRLEESSSDTKKKKSNTDWEIVPLDHGQVSIYFPAEKETSNLRFHIHAPFASTVARDSVRDCDANDQLRDYIANLVVESLTAIRDEGMLTVGFLGVLPNLQDQLSEFYEPIRQLVVEAFRDEPLTPTKSGEHAPATGIYRGPARISEVLSDEDLSLLANHDSSLWAANPPQQNQREDRFLGSLEIEEFGWGELIERLPIPEEWSLTNTHYANSLTANAAREHKQRIEGWIAEKKDAWIIRFYALLGEACDAYGKCLNTGSLRIVRVEGEQGQEHVLPVEAFLPSELDSTPHHGIHFVKPDVYSKGRSEAQKRFATSFLEHIGVRPFDESAVIALMLEGYQKPNQIPKSHFKDVRQFVAYWKKNPDESDIFHNHSFLLGVNTDAKPCWCSPEELCLDAPYVETGLASFLEIHGKNAIWDAYEEKLAKSMQQDFVDFLKAIGVMDGLKIEKTSTYNNPRKKDLHQYYSVRWSEYGIDADYSIPEINQYLAAKSLLASRLVWNALIGADRKVATARFRPNLQYSTRTADSQLVHLLKNHAWIPDKTGDFHKPEGIAQEDLPTDFPYDDRNGLLTAIGFGEQAKKQSEEYQARNEWAISEGFESTNELDEYKRFKQQGGTYEDLKKACSERQRASQPEESVPNPERRRKGVLERRDNAPTKESVTRERRIQPATEPETLEAKAYLRVKYKNLEGQLVCQCCHEEMPFKIREDHYFEAVQCVRGLDHHYFENRLALCPTCAAMYQHARETDDNAVRRAITELDAPDTASFAEITIRLAGRQFQLRFVGTHWFDLKTIFSNTY